MILPLLLMACTEPISNAIFEEDADFLAVLPTEERSLVRFQDPAEPSAEDPAGPVAGDAPDLQAWTGSVSGSVNGFIGDVLAWVDLIREYPPTLREENRRTWGPWPVGRMLDYALEVEIRREGTDVFAWEFRVGPEDGSEQVTFLSGIHYGGTTVAEGDGEFLADFTALSDLMGEDPRGLLAVGYDHRDGTEFLVDIAGWQAETGDEATDASYWYRSDDTLPGDLEYASTADVNGTLTPEGFQVRSRWNQEKELRGDVIVEGGDLGIPPVTASQCWSGEGDLLYQVDSAGVFTAVGSESACPFSEAAWPEHL